MWVFAAVAILFIGCNQTAVYEQYEGISNEQWEMLDTLCFSVPITDTTGHYNVLLHIRNTELYPLPVLRLPIARLPLIHWNAIWQTIVVNG